MSNLFLAGDIGGTNARFAVVRVGPQGRPEFVLARTTPTTGGPVAAAAAFVAEARTAHGPLLAGCFGVAGPVVDGRCYMPNAGFAFSEEELHQALGFRVRLVNDMVANAAGVAHLQAEDFRVVQAGEERIGHRALIAPGTGLGKAVLGWNGTSHTIVAGEGGHTDYGPRTAEEDALVQFLRPRFGGRVSAERLACGQGIPNIYAFFKETGRAAEPAWLKAELDTAGPAGCAGVVFKAAFERREPIACEVFRLWAAMLGSEAGNLALTAMSVGGLYLGGGVLPRMADWFIASGHFRTAFLDKAPHRGVVEGMPVRLITNPQCALIGAAGLAIGG